MFKSNFYFIDLIHMYISFYKDKQNSNFVNIRSCVSNFFIIVNIFANFNCKKTHDC